MEIVYYVTSAGIAPAKEYLTSRYGSDSTDTQKSKNGKAKRLATVEAVLSLAAGNNGIAGGELSAHLIGYDFQELRIKEGKELVRLLYFAHHRERLVLLHGYDKPRRYEKGKKKKVDNDIESIHRIAKVYYDDFIKNPDRYEPYEETKEQ